MSLFSKVLRAYQRGGGRLPPLERKRGVSTPSPSPGCTYDQKCAKKIRFDSKIWKKNIFAHFYYQGRRRVLINCHIGPSDPQSFNLYFFNWISRKYLNHNKIALIKDIFYMISKLCLSNFASFFIFSIIIHSHVSNNIKTRIYFLFYKTLHYSSRIHKYNIIKSQ